MYGESPKKYQPFFLIIIKIIWKTKQATTVKENSEKGEQ